MSGLFVNLVFYEFYIVIVVYFQLLISIFMSL